MGAITSLIRLFIQAIMGFCVSFGVSLMYVVTGRSKRRVTSNTREEGTLQRLSAQVIRSSPQLMDANVRQRIVRLADGEQMFCIEAGNSSDPLCVCVHGFPDCWLSYRSQIPFLVEKGYHVVVPHLRGYCGSLRPAETSEYSVDKLAGDLERFVGAIRSGKDQHKDTPILLLGHDWGAPVVYYFTQNNQETVSNLIVFNGPHMNKYEQLVRNTLWNPRQLLMGWYVLYFQMPFGLPEALFLANPADLLQKLHKKANLSEEEMELWTHCWCTEGAMKAMMQYYRAAVWSLVTSTLWKEREFKCIDETTVHIIWGKRDIALSPLNLSLSPTYVAEKCLHTISVENGSHWVHMDQPERCNRSIAEIVGV